jgi:hypothetical protein
MKHRQDFYVHERACREKMRSMMSSAYTYGRNEVLRKHGKPVGWHRRIPDSLWEFSFREYPPLGVEERRECKRLAPAEFSRYLKDEGELDRSDRSIEEGGTPRKPGRNWTDEELVGAMARREREDPGTDHECIVLPVWGSASSSSHAGMPVMVDGEMVVWPDSSSDSEIPDSRVPSSVRREIPEGGEIPDSKVPEIPGSEGSEKNVRAEAEVVGETVG